MRKLANPALMDNSQRLQHAPNVEQVSNITRTIEFFDNYRLIRLIG